MADHPRSVIDGHQTLWVWIHIFKANWTSQPIGWLWPQSLASKKLQILE